VGVGNEVGVKVGVGVGVSVGVGVKVGVAVFVAVGVGDDRKAPAMLTTTGGLSGTATIPNPKITKPIVKGKRMNQCLEFIASLV